MSVKCELSNTPRNWLSSAADRVPEPVAEPRRVSSYRPSGWIRNWSSTPAKPPCFAYVTRVSPVGRLAPPVGSAGACGAAEADGPALGDAGTGDAEPDGLPVARPVRGPAHPPRATRTRATSTRAGIRISLLTSIRQRRGRRYDRLPDDQVDQRGEAMKRRTRAVTATGALLVGLTLVPVTSVPAEAQA